MSRFFSTSSLLLLVVAGACLLMPGCGGCSQKTAEEKIKEAAAEAEKKADEKKAPPPYEWGAMRVRPFEPDRPQLGVKPGHWLSATMQARANQFDDRGTIETELIHGDTGQPIDLDGVPYRLHTIRSVVLPKGQMRGLEETLFTPGSTTAAQSRTRYVQRLGNDAFTETSRLSIMPAEQYFFVVLAATPDRYRFLEYLDTIRFPSDSIADPSQQAHYRVVIPPAKRSPALPASALEWTAIAYLLWDDRSPDDLSLDQQQALVDWLHSGGQLIVSGPDTIDTLRNSFLAPYLPATSGGAWALGEADLAPLYSSPWKVPLKPGASRPSPGAVRPVNGVRLEPRQDIAVQETFSAGKDPLVVERRVGRGRVVLTAFRLSQSELVNLPSFDRWFHGVVMRQPSRKFTVRDGVDVVVDWQDGRKKAFHPTRVSYLARNQFSLPATGSREVVPFGNSPSFGPTLSYEENRLIGPGLAAWDDYGKMPEAARRSLQEAAKIVVPDASFVLRMLGFYLLVLAANAVLFWLIGRIELAWATSPVIAIAATLTVVYVAQLDIGFVRARTEIGVVELDAGYPRAHFTRYMALYGSLGTSYDVEFADPTAVALPFYSGRELLQGQSRSTVRLVRQSVVKDDEVHATAVKLEGFQVASNATGLLHAEQMLDLGGSIKVDKSGKNWRLVNGTNLSLAGGGVVQKGVWTAWLGPLAPGESQELAAMNDTNAESEIHTALAALSTKAGVGLNLKELVDQVAHGDDKLRLVAWTEGEVGGMTISPSAAQMRAASLVVVHLEPGALEPIEIDANSRAAVDPKLPAMFPNPKAESNDD